MNGVLKKIGLTFLISAAPIWLFAQTNPCGDDPFDPSPCDLPLDDYVLVLVIAASLFGARYLNKHKNLSAPVN